MGVDRHSGDKNNDILMNDPGGKPFCEVNQ